MYSKRISKTVKFILLLVVCCLVTLIGFLWGFKFVEQQDVRFEAITDAFEQNQDLSPIDQETEGAIEVKIPRAASTSEIAEVLSQYQLIQDKTTFTIMSKFNGFDGNYQAGTHYLTPDLSYDEIMFILTHRPKPVKITFPEGLTYAQMKKKMLDAGMNIDERILDDMVKRPNQFLDYWFVAEIEAKEGREWLLQGYLFPDTYEFDPNADEESILRVFLDNTNRVLTEELRNRMKASDLSIDYVITLASIVQNEGRPVQMSEIAEVFRSRLRKDMKLESCATLNYLRSFDNKPPLLWLSNENIEEYADNPYNSYVFSGLVPGAICNPGVSAIQAVLWPTHKGYLYFVAMGDEDGSNDFSASLNEHTAKVNKYQQENALRVSQE